MGKRILFVSPTGTLDNGAEKSIVNLMAYLSKNSYSVFNVYPDNQHETHSQYLSYMEENGITAFAVRNLRWWWPEAPGAAYLAEVDVQLSLQQNIYAIRQLIRENEIDVVISNTANLYQGCLAAAFEEVSHLWLIHEFPSHEFAYYKEKIAFMSQQTDKVFAVVGNLNRALQPLFTEQTVETFVPYSQVADRDLLPAEMNRIVSIGRINENKNQLELLRAYRRLGEQRPPLILIGDWDADYKEKCDAYIEKWQLKDVEFLGHQSNPWDFVTESDICVYTSQSETFSLVFTESILYGVPTIASDNLGYQSAREMFQTGTLYPLGDVDELTNLIKTHLIHFSEYKKASVRSKQAARELYTLEHCYQAVWESLGKLEPPKNKTISALSGLIGQVDFDHLHSRLQDQTVTIYLADEAGNFSQNNTLTYPLRQSDTIRFELNQDVSRVRIDLSELPSFYSKVLLVNKQYNTVILPEHTNGLVLNNAYYFYEQDPQIIYNLPVNGGCSFELSYEMYDVDHPSAHSPVVEELATQIQQLSEKDKWLRYYKQAYEQADAERSQLKELAEELTVRYNSVVHSRRWIIPTMIINFFRRKK